METFKNQYMQYITTYKAKLLFKVFKEKKQFNILPRYQLCIYAESSEKPKILQHTTKTVF